MNTVKIKLNQSLGGYPNGVSITVHTDNNGLPLEKYWRRRFKDAKSDNCLEVIKPSTSKKRNSK